MKFSQIAKGTRATQKVELPMPGDAPAVTLLVRVLTGEERADAVAKGRAYAVEKGLADPKDGEEVYAIGVKAHVLATCCQDADKPEEPFFSSATEVLEGLDADRIAYLYEYWELHQDSHSPQRLNLSPDQFIERVLSIAGADGPDPFLSMRPSLRWTFTRILAAQWLNSPTPKSPSTSASEPSSTN